MNNKSNDIEQRLNLGTDTAVIKVSYNDYQGGDAGHGGNLNISINFSENKTYEIEPKEIKIDAKGDWEKEAVVKVFSALANILKPLEK